MRNLIFVLAFVAMGANAFTVDGPCDVHFSPSGGVTDRLVQYIGSAQKSIRVLAYNFTSVPVGDALVAAKQRGVDVELVLDKSVPTERNSELPAMLSAGIPAWIDRKHNIAHNKTIIIDGAWFETGSFNYSTNAESKNGENALICPSKDGAAAYLADWERHRDHSVPAK